MGAPNIYLEMMGVPLFFIYLEVMGVPLFFMFGRIALPQ